MANGVGRFASGAIGGGSALAATGNPWLIGAGALGGGLLSVLGEEPGLTEAEKRSNVLTLEGQELSNRATRQGLRSAKRIEKEEKRRERKKRSIGKLLTPYFKNLRR